MGGRSAWSQQAEAVRTTVGIDALAGRMVLGGAGEVERSPTGPRAQSWQLGALQVWRYKCDRWVRAAASVVQVSAEPAPAPAQWGW